MKKILATVLAATLAFGSFGFSRKPVEVNALKTGVYLNVDYDVLWVNNVPNEAYALANKYDTYGNPKWVWTSGSKSGYQYTIHHGLAQYKRGNTYYLARIESIDNTNWYFTEPERPYASRSPWPGSGNPPKPFGGVPIVGDPKDTCTTNQKNYYGIWLCASKSQCVAEGRYGFSVTVDGKRHDWVLNYDDTVYYHIVYTGNNNQHEDNYYRVYPALNDQYFEETHISSSVSSVRDGEFPGYSYSTYYYSRS